MKIIKKKYIIFLYLISINAFLLQGQLAPVFTKSKALEVLGIITNRENLENDFRNAKDCTISRMAGGKSGGEVYKIEVNGTKYVIKFFASHITLYARVAEITAQSIVAQKGYASHIYAYDLTEGWVIMDYAQGEPINKINKTDAKVYIELGKCLRTIHNGASFVPRDLKHFGAIARLETKLHRLEQDNKIPASVDCQLLYKLIALIKERYPVMLAPTHGDFNDNNIIFNKDKCPIIIDFGDAGQDDPFFDLGVSGVVNIPANHEYLEAIFLEAYFGHRMPTQYEMYWYGSMKGMGFLKQALDELDKLPSEFVKNSSTPVIPFKQLWKEFIDGTIDVNNQQDILKIAVSMLQEAVTICKQLLLHKQLAQQASHFEDSAGQQLLFDSENSPH